MSRFRRLRAVSADDATPIITESGRAAEALRAAGLGDEVAFSQFYDLTSEMVYGVVLKVLKDPAMSEETTQEVYLEIWRLAPRYEPSKGSARGWAATIAHRRAVDRVRSEQARRQRDDGEARHQPVSYDLVSEQVVDRLDRSRVRNAMNMLSEAQREAVTLAYYGGKTYREVAALLDVPEGTIKTRIRDGLIKLRDQFGVTA